LRLTARSTTPASPMRPRGFIGRSGKMRSAAAWGSLSFAFITPNWPTTTCRPSSTRFERLPGERGALAMKPAENRYRVNLLLTGRPAGSADPLFKGDDSHTCIHLHISIPARLFVLHGLVAVARERAPAGVRSPLRGERGAASGKRGVARG